VITKDLNVQNEGTQPIVEVEAKATTTTTPKKEFLMTLIAEKFIKVTTRDLIVLDVEQILSIIVMVEVVLNQNEELIIKTIPKDPMELLNKLVILD
jgi:hypothetical protein